MSFGLDTSVVLRLLTGKPGAEAKAAHERIEAAHASGEPLIVTDLVLAEAYFALQHHYGVSNAEARSKLLAMATSGVVVPSPPEAVAALAPASDAGVVDRLVHARHRVQGALTLTFNRKMAVLDGAVRIGS